MADQSLELTESQIQQLSDFKLNQNENWDQLIQATHLLVNNATGKKFVSNALDAWTIQKEDPEDTLQDVENMLAPLALHFGSVEALFTQALSRISRFMSKLQVKQKMQLAYDFLSADGKQVCSQCYCTSPAHAIHCIKCAAPFQKSMGAAPDKCPACDAAQRPNAKF